jgi:pimeloyl-ACP methyl ester carboxylesterase
VEPGRLYRAIGARGGGTAVTSWSEPSAPSAPAPGQHLSECARRKVCPSSTAAARLHERTTDRDKPISHQARIAQLLAIREAGLGAPHDLSRITQPTFVANGDNDVMVAISQSEDLARRIPNAKLTIYPDSGHGGIFQYHQQFVPAVLEFLESPA